MIGYKGFDKDFRCRGYQYEVGKTYHHDGDISICESGFHFCDTPLAVWEFYSPAKSRFALVEATGDILSDDNSHKFCTDELKILKELSLDDLIQAVPDIATKSNTGDCSAATNTGDRSAATNTGDCSSATNTGNCSAASNTGYRSAATNTGNCSSATNTGYCSAASNTGDCSSATNTGNGSSATNTGYRSTATVTGQHSIAIVTGENSKAKGSRDCWLVLTERRNGNILSVKAVKVDGVSILPDTFYTLKGGAPVIADDD